jgi:hypothetical protein
MIVAVVIAAAAAAVQQVAASNAADDEYAAKVQTQQQAEIMARSEREATHQEQIRERLSAERRYSKDSMESTLEAEELRGKALAQGANDSVSSAVFDQTERHIYMVDQDNQTSNIWNLQNNAKNIQAGSDASFRKETSRGWQNRAGLPPSGQGLAMAGALLGGVSQGLQAGASIAGAMPGGGGGGSATGNFSHVRSGTGPTQIPTGIKVRAYG